MICIDCINIQLFIAAQETNTSQVGLNFMIFQNSKKNFSVSWIIMKKNSFDFSAKTTSSSKLLTTEQYLSM